MSYLNVLLAQSAAEDRARHVHRLRRPAGAPSGSVTVVHPTVDHRRRRFGRVLGGRPLNVTQDPAVAPPSGPVVPRDLSESCP